jgi:hypothetical protein
MIQVNQIATSSLCELSECHSCDQQFPSTYHQSLRPLRYSQALSIDKAAEITKKYTKSEDLKYLQEVIRPHGNTVLNS